jgi:hypothetical protein
MILAEKIEILSKLGDILQNIGENQPWPGFEIGINQEEYAKLVELTKTVRHHNGWFTETAVQSAFKGIATWLNTENLSSWVNRYDLNESKPKTVAIIMAGNIPLVGFHDFIAVYLSGNKAKIKLSSSDNQLFPALLNTMSLFQPEIMNWVEIIEEKLVDFDAVIATGSNNSATYFNSYFEKYPHIIRKNRKSMAILTGKESESELGELAKDVFTYFGLGCRNVSMVWVPENYDVNKIFEAFYPHNEIINHNKYANNYDYNKAVYMMNLEDILDNGFILFKEEKNLNSPLGMLHVARYTDEQEIHQFIMEHTNEIQVVIGANFTPFGVAQQPKIDDYADQVDTMKFLAEL